MLLQISLIFVPYVPVTIYNVRFRLGLVPNKRPSINWAYVNWNIYDMHLQDYFYNINTYQGVFRNLRHMQYKNG